MSPNVMMYRKGPAINLRENLRQLREYVRKRAILAYMFTAGVRYALVDEKCPQQF